MAIITGTSKRNLLKGTALKDTIFGLGDLDFLFGLAGADILDGGLGNDTLDGGLGNDLMKGGKGNDTYVVGSAFDKVVEAFNQGTDLVKASVSYTLGLNVEKLTLIGPGNLRGAGNGLSNTITGNAGANILDGKAGADILIGGAGNDTFIVDNAGDKVFDTSGTDTVRASVSFTLGARVENLVLTGVAPINGTGNALANLIAGNNGANVLTGLDGADTLNGGGGNDTLGGGNDTFADVMAGGLGDDTYIIDEFADIPGATELAGQGTDTVRSSVSVTLGNAIENLILTGIAPINGTGNALNNILTGNGGTNTLDGGDGDDTMIGGGGADHFIGGIGIDTVSYATAATRITIDYFMSYSGPDGDTFAADVERIEGSAHGDTFEVSLVAPRTWIGGGGSDTIAIVEEGTSNARPQSFVVDLAAGTVVDTSGLTSGFTFSGIENFIVDTSGGAATPYDLFGDSNANVLQGGTASVVDYDVLDGRGGSDTLTGDTLNGFHNIDRFAFDAVTMGGTDTITDFTDTQDLIQLVGSQWGLTAGGSVASILSVFAGPDPTKPLHFDTATNTLHQTNVPGQPDAMVVLQDFIGTFDANDFILV